MKSRFSLPKLATAAHNARDLNRISPMHNTLNSPDCTARPASARRRVCASKFTHATRIGAFIGLGTLSSLLLPGCVAADKPATKLGPQPAVSKLSTMFMAAQTPRDSNSNGYLDTCLITVYIFPDNYPRSIQVEGTFELNLIGKGAKVLRTWSLQLPHPQVTSVNAGVGPGYFIKLSVLDDGGSDVMPTQSVDVVLKFIRKNGETVAAEPTSLLLGKSS